MCRWVHGLTDSMRGWRRACAMVVPLVAIACGSTEVSVTVDDATSDVTFDTIVSETEAADTSDTSLRDAISDAHADATTDATSDATDVEPLGDGGCTPVGGKCPASCPAPMDGQRYVAAGDCFAPEELFGCTYGVDSDLTARCRKQLSSGALYRFDNMEPAADDAAWGTCTDAESKAVTRWPPNGCTADAGADACAAFDAGDGCCCNFTDTIATPICVDGGMSCPAGYGPYHGDDCFRPSGPCWGSSLEAGSDG